MDNLPDPLGQTPASQLGAPTAENSAIGRSTEESNPANSNEGLPPEPAQSAQSGWLSNKLNAFPIYQKLPAQVRDFVDKRPNAAMGIAVLAGLGLLVARRRPR